MIIQSLSPGGIRRPMTCGQNRSHSQTPLGFASGVIETGENRDQVNNIFQGYMSTRLMISKFFWKSNLIIS
jgi:hypothetical protein